MRKQLHENADLVSGRGPRGGNDDTRVTATLIVLRAENKALGFGLVMRCRAAAFGRRRQRGLGTATCPGRPSRRWRSARYVVCGPTMCLVKGASFRLWVMRSTRGPCSETLHLSVNPSLRPDRSLYQVLTQVVGRRVRAGPVSTRAGAGPTQTARIRSGGLGPLVGPGWAASRADQQGPSKSAWRRSVRRPGIRRPISAAVGPASGPLEPGAFARAAGAGSAARECAGNV